MDVELKIKINLSDCLLGSFECNPGFYNNNLYFAYPCIDKEFIMPNGSYSTKIKILRIDYINLKVEEESVKFRNNEPYKFKIYDSKYWNFSNINRDVILHVGFSINLDTLQIESFNKSPIVRSEIKDGIRFDDYVIEYNKKSTIVCKRFGTNEILWKIKLIGFLYTEIERKGDTIFWGTAGKGGSFYAVDLESGKIITLYRNGDSSNYKWYNDNVVLKSTKGSLSLLNPYTGKEVSNLDLDGKIMGNRISVYGDRAVVFSHDLQRKTTTLSLVRLK